MTSIDNFGYKEKLNQIVAKYEKQIHELNQKIAELNDRNAELLEQNEGKMTKKSQAQQAEGDANENGATVGRRRFRLPPELLCEMAKWLPWKVQQKQQSKMRKNLLKKKMKKNHADLLLANHALSTFLGDRFRQFRAIRKKNRVSKKRRLFSRNQVAALENYFASQQFITTAQQENLAALLGLRPSQVEVWFKNRRGKWRRQQNNNQA